MIVRTYQTEVARQRIGAAKEDPIPPERVQRRWTKQCADTLDGYLAEGLTFGQIAKKMGRTRNSLIGFDWRRRRQ